MCVLRYRKLRIMNRCIIRVLKKHVTGKPYRVVYEQDLPFASCFFCSVMPPPPTPPENGRRWKKASQNTPHRISYSVLPANLTRHMECVSYYWTTNVLLTSPLLQQRLDLYNMCYLVTCTVTSGTMTDIQYECINARLHCCDYYWIRLWLRTHYDYTTT